MVEASAKIAPVPTNMALVRFISRLNVLLYRLSGGSVMGKMNGTPVCLVTMTRRKAKDRITIPVMYNPIGERVILVASLGGAPKNPAWYYNVIADPKVDIQVGWRRKKMLAKQGTPEEKAALWPEIIANFPSYDAYQRRTERDIPVIICSPVGGD